MKLKHWVISAMLLSFMFLVSHMAMAQDYVAPKFAVKLGYVMPTQKKLTTIDIPGAFGGAGYLEWKSGFALGFETYTASTPKSEIVIGLQWAQLGMDGTIEYDNDGNSSRETKESLFSTKYNWLHLPITYKFKFGQTEGKSGGLYLGLGPSLINVSGVKSIDENGDEVSGGGKSVFGYHLKGGYDFGKGAIDVEWSQAKSSGFDYGGLGIFGVYKF